MTDPVARPRSESTAIEAIRARIDGEFDHPALQAYGPLSDTFSDVIRIAEDAIRNRLTDRADHDDGEEPTDRGMRP